MKKILSFISIGSILCVLIPILFGQVLYNEIFVDISQDLDDKYMFFVDIPHRLLLFNTIILVLYYLIKLVRESEVIKNKLHILAISLYLCTLIFTMPHRYLMYGKDFRPDSYSYDQSFVYGEFWSDQGDFSSGAYDGLYFFIPLINKIVYFEDGSTRVEQVEFYYNKKVRIGDKIYWIADRWYIES